MKCFECGTTINYGEKAYWVYHGDQDDRICKQCAPFVKHTETIYKGMTCTQAGVFTIVGVRA